MIESVILVVSNLRKTFLVFMLMLLIGLRIILNVVLVLLVPMIAVILASYFSHILLSAIGLTIIGILGIIMLLVSSYLMGLFEIFAIAVWVITFDLLVNKKYEKVKDIDLGKNAFQPPVGIGN